MTFYDFLSQHDFFYEINENEYCLDDYILPYYMCYRTINNKSPKIFAKYIIINLSDYQTLNVCQKTIFKSYEAFFDFQTNNFSQLFFRDEDVVRYNIYLLFVYEKYEKELYDKISNDLNFARKIFLKKTEFENYFCFSKRVSEIVENSNEIDMDSINSIEKIVKKLHSRNLKCMLKNIEREELLACFINTKKLKNLDAYFLKGISEKNFFEENFYKELLVKKKKYCLLKKIKSIKMHRFRETCFNSEESINFGAVNVFYGENAIGKSSVLDAIEFAFTGQTHKYLDDTSLTKSTVILFDDGKQISSSDVQNSVEEYKKIWYKNKMGTLNELFCRINYFDTDATYRFALEEGNSDDAFLHLKKLLCDGKLIDMENNLIRNINSLSLIEKFFRMKVKKTTKQSSYDKPLFIKTYEFILDIFNFKKKRKSFYSDVHIYKSINQEHDNIANEAFEIRRTCEATLEAVTAIMHTQIELSLKLINEIFHRLYSYDSNIYWKNETFEMTCEKNEKVYNIKTMSTAQKVCLALSVIFTQFFSAKDAPRIILLDESVANFDSLHLLNLFDFLRDAALDNVQIFFTTASEDVAYISKNKFEFLGEEYNLYKLDKDESAKARIIKIN